MSVIDELITTHQSGDVYGVSDLNRIGRALIYIQDFLNENKYYITLPREIRTDWNITEAFPTMEDLNAILENIEMLRRTAILLPGLPKTPADMDELTATEANNIEKILYMSYDLVKKIITAFYYIGEIFAGEV